MIDFVFRVLRGNEFLEIFMVSRVSGTPSYVTAHRISVTDG